jgi:hypothetical protein
MVLMGNEGMSPHGYGEYQVKQSAESLTLTKVGGALVKLHTAVTHSLKAPGFNPWAYEVISWFQSFAFKSNLYRYAEGYSWDTGRDLIDALKNGSWTGEVYFPISGGAARLFESS